MTPVLLATVLSHMMTDVNHSGIRSRLEQLELGRTAILQQNARLQVLWDKQTQAAHRLINTLDRKITEAERADDKATVERLQGVRQVMVARHGVPVK